MTTFRPRLWTSVGAALLLSACSQGEPEKTGDADGTAAAPATAAPAPSGEAGETAGGEGGGGEAGAATAYANVSPESRTALRLAHLKGFFLVAQQALPAEGAESAAALAGQGMLEVFDPVADTYRKAGVNEQILRTAAEKGDAASLKAAVSHLDQVRTRVGGEPAQVVRGMVDIAAGLYAHVITDEAVDVIEYQHSYGAALAAKAELDRNGGDAALAGVRKDLDAFLDAWRSVTAPEQVAQAAPVGQVQAQASRVQLALSGA
jgi:hypothetical protein